jgi:hypothetical protein
MARFASGKNSYAISDRSGFRYRYVDMRREWTGSLVGKDEWEPKHPQLGPFKEVADAEALYNPRPDRVEPLVVYVGASSFPQGKPDIKAQGVVGFVTVVTT